MGPHDVRVKVAYAGLNFPDVLMVLGNYQQKPQLPFTPGLEAAGHVAEVGDAVGHVKPGDRVLVHVPNGMMADDVVVPGVIVHRLPDNVSLRDAAAFPVTYGTSYYALKERGALAKGESLVVLGAGGGVGLAAVEIGKAMGARVIAVASSPDKLEAARAAGATDIINYKTEDLRTRLKALSGENGVDVVYDPVGGPATEAALRCMAWGGRLLIIGFAAGEIPKLPANLPLLKNCDIRGVLWGGYTKRYPEENRLAMKELIDMLGQGVLSPRVSSEYAMEDAGQALAQMAERTLVGKAVIRIQHLE
jgi:NADPH:quinone reductase-like Zn-dependent oxidoreductase